MSSQWSLVVIFLGLSCPLWAADPSATASAGIAPGDSHVMSATESGANASVHAEVATGVRFASASSGADGSLTTSASASDGGISQLASAASSVRYTMELEGPDGGVLTGRLVADAGGAGRVSSELGRSGSLALAAFHQSFRTAASGSGGSIQWISQAGLARAVVSGRVLAGHAVVTPSYYVQLKSAALGNITIRVDNDDWVHWDLPSPQADVYPIESLALMSEHHAATIEAIRRAIDLNGMFESEYDFTQISIELGVDVEYRFDAAAAVDLTLRSGRRDVLFAQVSSAANSTSGGTSEARANAIAGVPDFSSMRFVVDDSTVDTSLYRIRIDGSDITIPVIAAPVPEPSTVHSLAAGLLVLWVLHRYGAVLLCQTRRVRR